MKLRSMGLAFWTILTLSLSYTIESRKFSDVIFTTNAVTSSVILPLNGNVFPLGYYSVSVRIGNPPKQYELDIDTGSDLTWLQCDAPCQHCTVPVERQYKYKHVIPCSDKLCVDLNWPSKPHCPKPTDQCDYDVLYADGGSSRGVLVKDQFSLTLHKGSTQPQLAFGCGYEQRFQSPPPPTVGVLGLGTGRISTSTQLSAAGVTRNVIGHCLSHKGGGYLFFGDSVVPSTGVTWMPMLTGKHYSAGPAEIHFNGKLIGGKNLNLIFDSGSTYTYFNSMTYHAILDLIKKDLRGKALTDAKENPKTLPVCWKGVKPFRSILDAKSFFKTLTLSFTNGRRKAHIQIHPESYLIISKYGNVCLGILNGDEIGVANPNIIGDIFMQGAMVIYDNEKKQIGWVPLNC